MHAILWKRWLTAIWVGCCICAAQAQSPPTATASAASAAASAAADVTAATAAVAKANVELTKAKAALAAANAASAAADSTEKPTQCQGGQNTITSFFCNWGIGVAVIKNPKQMIVDASLVNDVVRASSVERYRTDLILTKHWYFTNKDETKCGPSWFADSGLGCLGWFFGVGMGGGSGGNGAQLINLVGTGLIWGFGKIPQLDSDGRPTGFADPQRKQNSIGIGIGRRFNVRTFGDGINIDQALPSGETQIRYKTSDLRAGFLFYTYNF